MAERPLLFRALPLRNMSRFFKEAWRPVYKLRGRRSKEAAFIQGKAKGPMDPENLLLYSSWRQITKRTEKV